MEKSKTKKLKPILKSRTKEKITKIRKELTKKHLDLLKKMRAVGRPEPATFRSVDERVNHSATVTDGGLRPSIIEW